MTVLRIPTARVFLPLLQPSRYKGAYGGRGSAKSHFFGEHLVERCLSEPGIRAVCIREVQKSIKESSKRLLEDKLAKLDLGRYFDVQENQIKTPGDGLIIFTGMQDHTAESIKSLEGYRVAWADEAQSISQRSLDILRPTMRGEAEIWASWNPQSPDDPIDALLRGPNPPPRSTVVRSNWRDNPWFPEDLREEMEFDRRTDPDKHAWIWEGGYEPRSGPGRYFREEWLIAVEQLPPRESLRVYGGSDYAVTDEGGDYTAHVVIGLDPDGNPWVIDVWREQTSSDVWVSAFCDLVLKWRPMAWAEETGQIKSGVGPFLIREMRERRAYCAREQFPTRGDKAVRAQSIRGLAATRGLRMPAQAAWRAAFENELLRFPAGVHDDQVDACGLVGQLIDMMQAGQRPVPPEKKQINDYRASNEWDRADLDPLTI
jgi:predicted phage terminase large subunit-like protein